MNRFIANQLIAIFIFLHATYCEAEQQGLANEHRDLLQERVASNQLLDGVRIDQVRKKDDTLLVDCILANEHQSTAIEQLLTECATEMGMNPKEAHIRIHNIVPIMQFKQELQSDLSGNPSLKGVRLDRVFFGPDGHLQLAGIGWTTSQINGGQNQSELFDALINATMQFVVRDTPRWVELTRGGKIIVTGVKFYPRDRAPPKAIRAFVAAHPQFDGVHVEDTFYGPTGQLTFTGTASSAKQKTLLLSNLDSQKSISADWHSWIGSRLKPNFHVSDYIQNEQKKSEIENAIARVICSTQPLVYEPNANQLTDKVMIERLYYNADNKLAITGWRWNEIPAGKLPNEIGLPGLNRILKQEQEDDPELKGEGVELSGLPLFNMADTPFRSLLMAAWDLIPQHKQLDGLRIDRAYYKDGVLIFTGIQARDGQTAALKTILPLKSPMWQSLAPAGVKFDEFPIVATDTLRSDIQNEYAYHSTHPELDGTRIDRIFYQPDLNTNGREGKICPVFEIDQWFTGQPPGMINPAGKAADTIRKHLKTHPADWSRTEQFGDSKFTLGDELENPLPNLRQEVAQTPSLDGTRIDRAFYDTLGELHLSGLIGSETQLTTLKELVKETLNAKRSQLAANGILIARDRFELISNDRLLDCIRDLLPGYEQLDGAAISRIYFEPSKSSPGILTVDGRQTGGNQTHEISSILGKWLAQSFQGRKLLKYNANNMVQTNRFDLFTIKRDPIEAMSLLSTAWNIFFRCDYETAIHKLDIAILYDPQNTQLWMLRSICYVALGKIDYARRDARRAVLSMKNNKYRFHGRYQTLSRVQGPIRLCFESLMQEVWASRPNGVSVFLPPACF